MKPDPTSARSNRYTRLLVTLALVATASPLVADPPAGKPGNASAGRSGDAGLSVVISAGITFGEARRLATDHGLVGAKPLPPGIRKNLARGKPLPPGIAKTRMPDAFLATLPTHPGYEWRRLGTDLVLVALGTLIVAEILEGVFD